MKVSVVLPTLNEAGNIIPLIDALYEQVPTLFEVIVVDDRSPDGTAALVRDYSKRNPTRRVLVEERLTDPGLTKSLSRGAELAQGDVVVWMDCDFSMPPNVIPRLLRCLENGYDIAVGSRFVRGGSFKKDTAKTQDSALAVFLSRAMNYTIRYLLVPSFADYTSGFIAVRLPIVRSLKLRGDYGEYFVDFIYRAIRGGYRTIEIPYVCVPRLTGESKTGQNLMQYLRRGIKYCAVVLRLRLGDLFLRQPAQPSLPAEPHKNGQVELRLMATADVPLVARAHQRVLPDTLNSRLGIDFLENLYHGLLSDPHARCWAAWSGNRLLGFLSGTLQLHETSQHLVRQTPPAMKAWAGLRIMLRPAHLRAFISHKIYCAHCRKRYGSPFPLILTIGVIPEAQGVGVGRLLIEQADAFYLQSGLARYYVDTLKRNQGAVDFYVKTGFLTRETIDGSVLFYRELRCVASIV